VLDDFVEHQTRTLRGNKVLIGLRLLLATVSLTVLLIQESDMARRALTTSQLEPPLYMRPPGLVAIIVCALTILYVLAARRSESTPNLAPKLAFLQIFADIFLVSALVWNTGGVDSQFVVLYLISICSAAIVLKYNVAILAAAVAATLFSVVTLLYSIGIVPVSIVQVERLRDLSLLNFVRLLLLPVCAGAALTLGSVMRACGGADLTLVPILAGAACWVAIYLLLPKPMWIYVFGHELTHALWVWLFGGRVKKFKASSEGGHVIVDKTNFFIALAPYFFPLYASLVVALFAVGNLIWNWQSYLVWFHLLVGAAYAFHVTLTAHVLKTRQSDITSQGYLFSAVAIFLGNTLVLLVGLPLLTAKVDLITMLGWWFENTGEVIHRLGKMF